MVSIVVNDVSPIIQITASAGQTVFTATNIMAYQSDEMIVYQRIAGSVPDDTTDVLTLTTDYTVSQLGDNNGFIITLVSGAVLNDIVTIVRDIPIDRQSLYVTSGTFTADTVNLDFNYQTLFTQDRKMIVEKKGLTYENSAVIESKDLKLPQLVGNQTWVMNAANTGITAIDYDAGLVKGETNYGLTTGGPTTYLSSITDFGGNIDGMELFLKFNVTNTGASTININSSGAVSLTKETGIDFSSGDLLANYIYCFIYQNSKFTLSAYPTATNTNVGLSRIATGAEVTTATNEDAYVTPKTLSDNLDTKIPITDSTAVVKNASDVTKLVKISAASLTTGTTKTITMPDNDVDLDNIKYTVQATESQRGTAEIATDAEVITGTDDTAYITSKKMHDHTGANIPILDTTAVVKNAVDTTKLIKFDASGIATSTTRTITMPNSNVDLTNVSQATESQRGTAELATSAEALALTDDTKIITAAKLSAVLDQEIGMKIIAASQTLAGGTQDGAYDLTVSKTANGRYTYTFGAAQADTNYVVIASVNSTYHGTSERKIKTVTPTTTTFKVETDDATTGHDTDHTVLVYRA
ncbi:MAG: hypothetical protein ACTSP4_00495 [Candidatus Hodarchaeales archaeon]